MKTARYLVLAMVVGTISLGAHEKHGTSAGRVVGEVIDTVCYVSHDSRGPEHLECARECAKNGVSLGILEEKTGRIYLSLPVDHTNPNDKLMKFIARRVEVRGQVFRKGGLTGFFVESVRELPASGSSKGEAQ